MRTRRADRWKLHLRRRYHPMHGRSFVLFCFVFLPLLPVSVLRARHPPPGWRSDLRTVPPSSCLETPGRRTTAAHQSTRCPTRRWCHGVFSTPSPAVAVHFFTWNHTCESILLSGGACWLDGQEEQQQGQGEEEEHQIVEEHASLCPEGEPSFMLEEMTGLHLSGTQEETDECEIEVTEFVSLRLLCFASGGWSRPQQDPSSHLLADTGFALRVFQ